MQPKFINPYPLVGTKHKEALDFIIANLPADPTFEQLNEILHNAMFPGGTGDDYIAKLLGLYPGMVLPNAYNGYVNTGGRFQVAGDRLTANTSLSEPATCNLQPVTSSNIKYTDKQLLIINHLMQGIKSVSVEAIPDFLEMVSEKIVSSGLTYEEQLPLFIAVNSGISDCEYWGTQIDTPGAWAPYLTDNKAINYSHLAGLVSAAMQGALLTYGLVRPPESQTGDILSAMTGSIGLVAGKVVFGWVQL